jgi:hypothetical protein
MGLGGRARQRWSRGRGGATQRKEEEGADGMVTELFQFGLYGYKYIKFALILLEV